MYYLINLFYHCTKFEFPASSMSIGECVGYVDGTFHLYIDFFNSQNLNIEIIRFEYICLPQRLTIEKVLEA